MSEGRNNDLGFKNRPEDESADVRPPRTRKVKRWRHVCCHLAARLKRDWHDFGIRTLVVFSVIRLFPSSKQRAQLIELLRSVQDLARPSPGCLGCWLSEEDFQQTYVCYAEQWESEQALNEHLRSDLYRRLLAAMELSKQAPEVRFYCCSEMKGLELIESARDAAKPRSRSNFRY